MMEVNKDYLQGLGAGLQGLRAMGQFCDAMVCVGSARILVHKVVLSAASKTLHDMALNFDMMPHQDHDQLKIIIPPDISLYAVNMFINFIYTGQLELSSQIVSHIERLATLYGVTHLMSQCQEFIQRSRTPDSQNLDLRTVNQTEADSSLNGPQAVGSHHRLSGTPDVSNQGNELSRSNSSCSGISAEFGHAFSLANVKKEPARFAAYEEAANHPGSVRATKGQNPEEKKSQGSGGASISMLEKLMSPVVNLKKLPASITPDVIVMVSDEEDDGNDVNDTGDYYEDEDPYTNSSSIANLPPSSQALKQKEELARRALTEGVETISKLYHVPIQDLNNWLLLFGFRKGKQINYEADLAAVKWAIEQHELNGNVEISKLKDYAIILHQPTNPKFCASKTWVANFFRRNASVLRGIKFLRNDKTVSNVFRCAVEPVRVKQEVDNDNCEGSGEPGFLESLGNSAVLEDVPLNEQSMVNDAIMAGFNSDSMSGNSAFDPDSFASTYVSEGAELQPQITQGDKPTTQGSILTPFGKRPIIVGQSKSLDAKSERKIVQWVLERNAEAGYVFTDDFKNYAKTLYKGDKLFAATQCWMKKFLRRNRILKDVKFCSKFKNQYTNEEKVLSVTMAKRFGVGYAAQKTGINQKVIHHWKLASDKGLLNLDPLAQQTLTHLERSSMSPCVDPTPKPSILSSQTASATSKGQAFYGIVPEFENRIVQQIQELQAKEGSVNYSDISQISQSVYKETRPSFKASYRWVRTFLDRHKEELSGIDLENVSKVLVEADEENQQFTSQEITQMVDNALKDIDGEDPEAVANPEPEIDLKKFARPIIVGPSVMFDRKTEKKLVEWALQKHNEDGYVFTDDFKAFAKTVHTGEKHFSASSGWMSLFLRRHRELKDVKFRSKYKNVYTEEEKKAAVAEAKRLGTGHVARQLGIDSALLCAWRIKMDKAAPKQHTFWKGTKLKKFGRMPLKFNPIGAQTHVGLDNDTSNEAARGIVPEFEKRIVDLIHEEHNREGSISYEEMSKIAQSVYKETRPTFKASYGWIRQFMNRNQHAMSDLDIDNVKKVYVPEEDTNSSFGANLSNNSFDMNPGTPSTAGMTGLFQKRPIIVGQSRSLDTKTERKLVQWVVEQQNKNGYVFLDQFKAFAQSLYRGEKRFAATQAWRIKFLRRNHVALKHVKFTSSFRNQYSMEEKIVIVQEAKKYGVAHVSKQTGIDHCLINQWRLKLEREGLIPADGGTMKPPKSTTPIASPSPSSTSTISSPGNVGPGLLSARGIVPALEKKIVHLIMGKMDKEGSASYKDVSLFARAVYKESRPQFKASYNWVKDFIRRNKKDLRHVEFEKCNKNELGSALDVEVLINGDIIGDIDEFVEGETMGPDGIEPDYEDNSEMMDDSVEMDYDPPEDPMIVIDNPEVPNYSMTEAQPNQSLAQLGKRPIIIGKAKHFSKKEEKKIVEWLVQTHEREGFVFTDDFRRYAKSLYTGEPGKFGATNAWITKFLRRNRLENKIDFRSRLVGNNPKYEERIVELILEHQEKEGSVSNDDIQKITVSVYKEIRPNFRACYNWIRDFIKRHKDKLAGVELENVKKVFFPDENEKDGILIRDYDPSMNLQYFENPEATNSSFAQSTTNDFDSSMSFDPLLSSTPSTSSTNVVERLTNQKRPIIIAPPKVMDIKTEKKLVQWMIEQQKMNGCVYLDLFKDYARSIHTGPKHFAATQAWMVRFKQRNHAALKNVVIKSRFRNEYSIEEKIAIVEEAKRLGCNHVGRKLGINGGVIYSWKVQLESAEELDNLTSLQDSLDAKIPDGDSARGIVPEFETAIVSMVLEIQQTKGSVSYEDVGMCARSVYQETRPQFKASNNWILDFIRKYKDEFQDVVFENQRKVLSEEEKLHILSEEKKYGTNHVVQKRNISSKTLYNWKRQFKAKSVPIPKFKSLVSSKIKKKYAKNKPKIYTMEEKREMVRVAEQNGITHAALKLGVSRNLMRKWINNFRDMGEQIVINFTPASTLKKELEQKVIAWVLEQNEILGIVLTTRIISQAKKIFEESYTNCNANVSWLQTFLASNSKKFEHVRFRDKGDADMEFSDEIKLKVSKYAHEHGAVETADLVGLLPKTIYHWRRCLKQKGLDISSEMTSPSVKEDTEESSKPKSIMQMKLDKIAAKYDESARKQFAIEARIHGTSSIAAKYKIPLPLVLKWVREHIDGRESFDTIHSRSPSVSSDAGSTKLKIKLPGMKVGPTHRHNHLDKSKLVEEAKKEGAKTVALRSGVGLSTMYQWLKEERESSTESQTDSTEMRSSKTKEQREPSTPKLLLHIKTEPGLESPSVSSDSSFDGKRMIRKYSDEFKLEVAKRAMVIGTRPTAAEMDIPFTNVKRWLDAHKPALLRAANKAAKQPAVASPSLKSHQLASLKRKLSDIPHVSPKRSKYSDDERLEFAKMTEVDGVQAVALKADVSVDVVYKWRSKYLPIIRASRAAAAAETLSGIERENSPAQYGPGPRSTHFTNFRQSVKTEIPSDDEGESFIHNNSITTNTSDRNETVDGEIETEFKHSDIQESEYPNHEDEPDNHEHVFDDDDILAADQILEMMDAKNRVSNTGDNGLSETNDGKEIGNVDIDEEGSQQETPGELNDNLGDISGGKSKIETGDIEDVPEFYEGIDDDFSVVENDNNDNGMDVDSNLEADVSGEIDNHLLENSESELEEGSENKTESGSLDIKIVTVESI